MDDDATGSQYHSRLVFKLDNDQNTHTVNLQEIKGLSLNQRNNALDEVGKGNMNILEQLTKDIAPVISKDSIEREVIKEVIYQEPIAKEIGSIHRNLAPARGNLDLDHLFQINKSVTPEVSMTNAIRTENIKGLVPPFIMLKTTNDMLRDIKNSDILNSSNKSVFSEEAATHLNNFNKVQLFSTNNVETSKEFFR